MPDSRAPRPRGGRWARAAAGTAVAVTSVMNAAHLAGLVGLAVLGSTAVAHAEAGDLNPSAFDLSGAVDQELAPVHRALELAVGGSYIQGAGELGAAQPSMQDASGGGGGAQLELAYRSSPAWSFGAYGTFARFAGDVAGSETAGFVVTAHARPDRTIDPWLSVGAGWRQLRLDDASGTTTLHGVDLARVQLGVDYRISRHLAITPFIGASVATFLAEDAPMAAMSELDGKRLSVFALTGVAGRFAMGD